MAYNVKDFSDIVSMVMEELKLDSNDSAEEARIKRDVNAIYLDEVVPFKRWKWLYGTINKKHAPYIADGTVSVTPNSATVTFSFPPAIDLDGYFFSLDNFEEIYTIASHTASSATATLSSVFTGTLNATAGYKVWTNKVRMPIDCREILEVYHDFYADPLEGKGLQDFRRISTENPKLTGRPAIFTSYDFEDPTPDTAETEADRYRLMMVYPAIDQVSTTLHVDYIKEASVLDLDADEPLMPIGDRIVLVYGALARAWTRARNLESAAQNQRLFESRLARMAGQVEDAIDKPQITPDSRYMARKRGRGLRGTSRAAAFSGGASYSAPSYLENVTINGATITGNVTASTGITIDGRDISVDGATLDAHIADTSDAHDASAISVTPAGNLAADDVQEALTEHQGDIDALDTRVDYLESNPGFPDGLVTAPGIKFADDANTGIYSPANDSLALAAGGNAGLQVKKSTGDYANVGMGGDASTSDLYPLLAQRDQASPINFQLSNPNAGAGAGAKFQLVASAGNNGLEVGLFAPATAAPDAYAGGNGTIRSTGTTAGIAYIADDSGAYHKFYVGGNSASEKILTITEDGLTLNTEGVIDTPDRAGSSSWIELLTGDATGGGSISGGINLQTGASDGESGTVSIQSGHGTDESGDVNLETGSSGGDSGTITMFTGTATAGDSGSIVLGTGDSTSGNAGDVSIFTGTGVGSVRSEMYLQSKSATDDAYRLYTTGATNQLATAAAITAGKALISDANGIPTHSAVTSTELGYVAGVTSSIQTQINAITGLAVTSKTSNYTATTSDNVILCSASGGAFSITLYAASGNTGRVLRIKKTDASVNAVTIDGNGSETIDGDTTLAIDVQYEAITIVCDGSNWMII